LALAGVRAFVLPGCFYVRVKGDLSEEFWDDDEVRWRESS
jgi:hypothetical protein